MAKSLLTPVSAIPPPEPIPTAAPCTPPRKATPQAVTAVEREVEYNCICADLTGDHGIPTPSTLLLMVIYTRCVESKAQTVAQATSRFLRDRGFEVSLLNILRLEPSLNDQHSVRLKLAKLAMSANIQT